MQSKIFLASYTIAQAWETDPIAALDQIAKMGYEGVEFGVDLDEHLYQEVKTHMAQLGLIAVDTHIAIDDMADNFSFYLPRVKDLGMKYVIIPWLDENRLPGGTQYAETKKRISQLISQFSNEGITLCYHNHNFEFEKIDGVCKLDILLGELPLLKSQLDVCWCEVGGQKPEEYIKRYGSRMPLIHLKDYRSKQNVAGVKLFDLLGLGNNEEAQITRESYGFEFQPVGDGVVNFAPILASSQEAGIAWLGVEQDASLDREPLEAAKRSIDFLRAQPGLAI
jgi:sugar phosphate isomerase/epimerase